LKLGAGAVAIVQNISLCFLSILVAACQNVAGVELSAPMHLGETAVPPFGFMEFCDRMPQDCRPASGTRRPVRLTAARWQQLNQVNDNVNETVTPLTDQELYQRREYWTYPSVAGDCEDFVLLKRKRLLELGWPANALLISVAYDRDGAAHAVLVVTTSQGDYVLDNQIGTILPWRHTPYVWSTRQSTQDPLRWVSLRRPLSEATATSASP